jgi:histidinol dehydrogenase
MSYNFLKIEAPKKTEDLSSWLEGCLEIDSSVGGTVSKILGEIKVDGNKAVLKYCKEYDGLKAGSINEIKVSRKELEKGYSSTSKMYPDLIEALEVSYKNIEKYHTVQFEKESSTWYVEPESGKKLGQIFRPIKRVGVYIPGGRYIYPSSVLMTIIPAKVAGVEEIVVCSPPNTDGNLNNILLYLFSKLDIDEIYKIGGVQAIGALAYGTESIRKVDKIVGPGNIFVTTAKKMVFGEVGIDGLAGPSEVVILADSTANPDYIAADLISQAEHDPQSKSILLTTCRDTAKAVIEEIYSQADFLIKDSGGEINASVILESLKKNCRIVYNSSDSFLIDICNTIAPEHLEIMMKDCEGVLKKIKNAGAIFLGDYTPVAVGDYIAGTNHVIPTGTSSRFSSPLGIYDFYKRSSIAYYNYDMLRKERKYIEVLADYEKMLAHSNSIKVRFKNKKADKNG